MYTITFLRPCTTFSISRWKLDGAPSRPIGVVTHWNWPFPGTVKAVYGLDLGWSSSCQNPAVKSMVVKRVEPDLPISPMHSVTSFIEYLSTKVSALRALKSCTNRIPPFFFATAKRGLLNLLLVGWTTPILSHSATCFSTSTRWASGILNCFT